jgi:acyl-CoA oxidase
VADPGSETFEEIESVDPAALGEYLDHPYEDVRRQSREMFDRAEFELPDAEIGSAEYREKVLEWAQMLAAEGQTTRGFPAAYGGGDDIGGSIAAFETLAMGDLSLLVKCGVQFGLFGGAVLHLGTQRHHDAYLADIATLKLPGCFAMSESAHGSDVQSVGTTATYDRDAEQFVIETPDEMDRKDWIGNAALHGQMAVVFAQLIVAGENHGVHALLVPIRSAKGKLVDNVRIEDVGHKVGLNGVDNGRIYFDRVRVPRENLLDRYGTVGEDGRYRSPIENPTRRFFTMVGTLVQGRVSVAGGAIAVAKVTLATAIRYGLRRRQFGPPDGGEEILLLDYRAHQRRLLPLLAKTYALQFVQDEMIDSLDRIFSGSDRDEEARRALETKAAGVKAVATWHAIECVQSGREACGGLGYLDENGFGRRQSDIEIFSTFEGDNTVLLQLVAKSLLTGYRDEFGELNPLGMAAFFAGEVVDRVLERSAAREIIGRIWDEITPDSEEEGDLANHDYQEALLAWREEHLLSTAARRLRVGIDAGYDPFVVFNAVQDHVLSVARAHVDRLILEAFIAGVERCEHDDNRRLLGKVCDLYALSVIEADRGWFQEHGKISSTRSKAVIRSVNRLCGELRPHAADLVDALAVPDAVLGPIGRSAAAVESP